MGLTTGFLSGLTLTTGTLYLTILLHRRNRYSQSHALASSTAGLTTIYDSPPLRPPPTERVESVGLVEMAKDRWNAEVVELVRRVNTTDWRKVSEDAESIAVAIARRVRTSFNESTEGVGKDEGK